jgi:hypothetical protein
VFSDPQAIAEDRHNRKVADRAGQLADRQEDADLRELIAHEWGRRLLWTLGRAARATPATIADTTNVHETFLRLGRASEAWRLLQRTLAISPQTYAQMAQDAANHDRTLLDRARNELALDAANG